MALLQSGVLPDAGTVVRRILAHGSNGLSRVRTLGCSLMGVGALGVVGGGILLGIGSPGGYEDDDSAWRRTGAVALTGVGAALMVLGALVLFGSLVWLCRSWEGGWRAGVERAVRDVCVETDAKGGEARVEYREEAVVALEHVVGHASVKVGPQTLRYLRIESKSGRTLHAGMSVATHGFIPGTTCVCGLNAQLVGVPCMPAPGHVIVSSRDLMAPATTPRFYVEGSEPRGMPQIVVLASPGGQALAAGQPMAQPMLLAPGPVVLSGVPQLSDATPVQKQAL